FVNSALALLHTRVELAVVELAEERERLTRSAMLIAGAVFMLSFALLGVAAWIVVYFWDTHRLEAIAGVTIVFALAGGFLVWRNAVLSRESPVPFSATLAELSKDRAWLEGGGNKGAGE
ncbi:MAG TPA: phage holin family protein, partial [Casimicrobiaceae bacterium]|nr:phage holin family protein [Casimicrobiaceae bacterium]